MIKVAVLLHGNSIGWGGWNPTIQECCDFLALPITSVLDMCLVPSRSEEVSKDRYDSLSLTTDLITYHFIQPGCSMYTKGVHDDYERVLYFSCPDHALHIWDHEYSMSKFDLAKEILKVSTVYTEEQLHRSNYQTLAVVAKNLGIDLEVLQERLNQEALKNGTAQRTKRTIELTNKNITKEKEKKTYEFSVRISRNNNQ
jgi:hypothetical protein